jgi:hypothetical protein
MRVGCGRVSTRDQNPDGQRDALAAAGCDEIYIDKVSGKRASRPELDKALMVAARAGDQLVITKLDRLGRSLEHLIALSTQLQTRGVDLVVPDQGIDTSTAVGRMFFQILGAIAEFEHALMSDAPATASPPPAPADEPEEDARSSPRTRLTTPNSSTTQGTHRSTNRRPASGSALHDLRPPQKIRHRTTAHGRRPRPDVTAASARIPAIWAPPA